MEAHGHEVAIPVAAGLELAGRLHLPERPPAAGVVICHGMLSHKDSDKHLALAQRLCAAGLAALRFDFQGRGQSPGDMLELTYSRQLVEARAAAALLRRDAGVRRLGLAGSSMGGAVAVLLAASGEPPVAALATMAAVGRPGRLGERMIDAEQLAAWQRRGWIDFDGQRVGWAWLEDGRRSDVIAAAGRIGCPWLLLHGERDEVVPPEDGRLLAAAAGGRAALELVAGADHRFSDPALRERAVARVADFLSRQLAEPSA